MVLDILFPSLRTQHTHTVHEKHVLCKYNITAKRDQPKLTSLKNSVINVISFPFIHKHEMKGEKDMLYFLYFALFILLFICGMTILRTGLYNLSAKSLKK